ncbi:hypothetical protein [Hyalangium minutum]|uniref:B box-type domain-containing protein n=1 Tax=Hyalangium minutum TaxID=394096 RepID=A0A085WJZ5_9BACT|nr:hypothetical protein [Hyalangium minutum]KFE68008.1 hypothetical protein DB31_7245 [Hyalangium minutum]
MLTPEPAGARCANHPEAAAVASCARCGTFLCGACTELLGEAASCASCLALLHKGAVPPRRMKVILALNVLVLVTFPLLGALPLQNLVMSVLGLWVGTRERRRIRESQGAVGGAGQAWLALGLGVVNGLLVLAWVGLLVSFIARRGRW